MDYVICEECGKVFGTFDSPRPVQCSCGEKVRVLFADLDADHLEELSRANNIEYPTVSC